MKISTLNPDGTRKDAQHILTILDTDGEPYTDPPVSITVRIVPSRELREIERACTTWDKNQRTRGMQRITDWNEVAERTLEAAVTAWSGVLSDEDEPVELSGTAVRELPLHVKQQVLEAAGNTEASDDRASSFRQLANVV